MCGVLTFVWFFLNPLTPAVTPLDEPLPQGKITTIECESKDKNNAEYKDRNETWAKARKEIYHYKVYVPEGYGEDTTHKYPAIFFFSPDGNATMGDLQEWLAREKWIAIMMVEAKNGPWAPIIYNFNAAYDDAKARLRLQPGLFFATGFSGGARASSLLAYSLPGFAGVLLQGAGTSGNNRINEEDSSGNPDTFRSLNKKNIAIYMAVGAQDPAKMEWTIAQKILDGKPDWLAGEIFDGAHEPAPNEVMIRGLEWLKERAFLNAEAGTLPLEAVVDAFQVYYKGLSALPKPLAKIDRLNCLLRLAAKYNLDKGKESKEVVDQVRKQLADLQKDPDAKKELAARDAFNKVKEFEDSTRKKLTRTKATNKDFNQELTNLIQAYAAMSKQYKNTEYAAKADQKVQDLTKERR